MAAPVDEETLKRLVDEMVAAKMKTLEAELAARGASAGSGSPLTSPRPLGSVKLGPPPEYTGNLPGISPTSWLYKVSSYLNATGVTGDTARIAVAGYHLSGAALSWWRRLEALPDTSTSKPKTWGEFCTALTAMFQDTNPVEHARDRLAALEQRTSVRQYATLFRNTAIEIPDISNDELKDRFLRGLKAAVKQEVRMRQPATFDEAVQVAERYDSLRYGTTGSGSGTKHHSHFFGNKAHEGPAPMDLGAVTDARQRWGSSNNSRASGNQPSSSGSGLSGKLTPELRQKLIREGRCFYCRETGHRALACPKRKQPPK